ncbi:HDOD domain-containing protein [Alienimonas californiensis]|uniref:HDOD domain protein n=1 Tax=Alienimonas californiensis TaxID=2527989 RepID=A0A517P7T1_9PLAN|nr:HDOD domain-containing protein [Alienimonas californiensis]QDT15431.1 HDOD domain protein [Alienimonas californiensis]
MIAAAPYRPDRPDPRHRAVPRPHTAPHPSARPAADPAKLDAYLSSVAELQAGDLASRRLLALTGQEDYDMRELVRCVECDPALTAKLLRVVNGARYGLRHRVTGVRRAAAYVGRRSLRLLAVTFSLADRFSPDKPLHAAVWRRAVVSAAAAAELAKGGSGESPAADEAYTAALICDLGVMLLGGFDPSVYPELHLSTPHGPDLLAAERARFGLDHAELGGRFLLKWGLPEELANAAGGHHLEPHEPGPDGDPPAALDVVVRIADRLADAILDPTADRVEAVDALVREWFPGRSTGRLLAGVLSAAAEDADLYPGVSAPDQVATTTAWAERLNCPELTLAAARPDALTAMR